MLGVVMERSRPSAAAAAAGFSVVESEAVVGVAGAGAAAAAGADDDDDDDDDDIESVSIGVDSLAPAVAAAPPFSPSSLARTAMPLVVALVLIAGDSSLAAAAERVTYAEAGGARGSKRSRSMASARRSSLTASAAAIYASRTVAESADEGRANPRRSSSAP
jgi:hypothetical protein